MDFGNVNYDIYFSFLYLFLVLCFILPPREVIAAGLTIQNLFSSYLGSEQTDFIGYHLKRTTITVVIHCLLPMIYYLGLGFVSPEYNLLSLRTLSPWGVLFALLCFSCLLCGILVGILWTISNFKYHPLTRNLLRYGSPWRAVAAQINLEFRRLEKFSSIAGGTSTYVTDSWIIKCSTYTIHVAQQTDAHLTVIQNQEFLYNQDTNQSAQFLKIKVMTIPPHEQTFYLNLNSLEYSDLKDRLSSPLRTARDVVIHQTLSERFLEAFKHQVEVNGRVEIPSIGDNDIENCIGCMAKQADIKLVKRCASLSDGDCKQCYCRPMWCLECMGKWYASRQDQKETEGWMSSTSPCPTCRAKFCMLDVFKIQ